MAELLVPLTVDCLAVSLVVVMVSPSVVLWEKLSVAEKVAQMVAC